MQGQLANTQASANSQQVSTPVIAAPVNSDLTNVTMKKVPIKSVKATSSWNSNYNSPKMIDGKHNTAWYSKRGQVSGQAVKVTLNSPQVISRVHMLIPQNQWGQAPKYFDAHFPDGSTQRINLEKKWGWQRLAISPKLTDTIDIEFGEQFNDEITNVAVTLSELEIYSSSAAPAPQTTSTASGQALAVKSISASSTATSSRSAHAVFDGYNETSWRTKQGHTDNHYISFAFNESKTVTGFRFLADQEKLSELPKLIRVNLDDGSSVPINVQNINGWQTVPVTPPIQSRRLTLYFKGMHNDRSKNKAIGFSEMEVLGR